MMPLSDLCIIEDINDREAFKKWLGISGQLMKAYGHKFTPLKKGQSFKLDIAIRNAGLINPTYLGPLIHTLNESNDFMAIDKPFGIHSFPHGYDEHDNVLSFLRSTRPEILNVNNDSYDRGLLYRLDQVTSGVLIYVKNELKWKMLRDNFDSLAKTKEYLAIIRGESSFNNHHCTYYFTPTGPKGALMKVSPAPVNSSSVKAELFITTLSNAEEKSLVKVKLITGVRHQIRAQLAHLGHPIIGDVHYGGPTADRVYLHAYRYEVDGFVATSKSPALFERFFDLNSCL